VRTIVRIFLERGCRVHRFAAKLPVARKPSKKAQELKTRLVLLDLRLPGMNGIETATALKPFSPQNKLVLFLCYADSLGNRTWASAIGVDLVVPKGSLIDMAASLKS